MQTRLIFVAFLPDIEQKHTLADKTAKAQCQMNSHLQTFNAASHILYLKHPLLTITECRLRAKKPTVTCVFIISKYTQLLASSVASEQCWQPYTSSTRDTLREIVGGTGPRSTNQSLVYECLM